MKARPILFSGPMVRAILDGRKTQTRRAVKESDEFGLHRLEQCINGRARWHAIGDTMDFSHIQDCPYGRPGDLLWVRETFTAFDKGRCHYRADFARDPIGERDHGITWTPSIHMPRWASRLTLEITDVRVERLQDISEDDLLVEGIAPYRDGWTNGMLGPFNSPALAFVDLWESTGGDWNDNPWVWVVEFKAHQTNVDQFLGAA